MLSTDHAHVQCKAGFRALAIAYADMLRDEHDVKAAAESASLAGGAILPNDGAETSASAALFVPTERSAVVKGADQTQRKLSDVVLTTDIAALFAASHSSFLTGMRFFAANSEIGAQRIGEVLPAAEESASDADEILGSDDVDPDSPHAAGPSRGLAEDQHQADAAAHAHGRRNTRLRSRHQASADVDWVDDDGPDGLTNEELQDAEQEDSDVEGLACPQGQSPHDQHRHKATLIEAHMLLDVSNFVVSTRAGLLAVTCA